MAVPYTFATATSSIPLSQLDSNFATAITLGNTAVYLGNTTTSIGNLTLTNTTISSVAVTFPNSYLSNSSVTLGTTNVSLGGTATTLANLTLSNVTITGGTSNVTQNLANVTGTLAVANGGTGLTSLTTGYIPYGNGTSAFSSSSGLTYQGSALAIGSYSAGYGALQVRGGFAYVNEDGADTHQLYLRSFLNSAGPAIQVVSNDPLLFTTNNTERMRLDSSGNLGLGVTPSAWSGQIALQVGQGASLVGSSSSPYMELNANLYFNGNNRYLTSNYSTQYVQNSGQHQFYVAPSGTAGNVITYTQAMTLDNSGNLGIGTTSQSTRLQITNASASGTGIVNTLKLQHLGTSADDGAKILFTAGTSTDGAGIGSGGKALNSANLLFYTGGNNERMRIDQDGKLLIGTTTASLSYGSGLVAIKQSGDNGIQIEMNSNNSGIAINQNTTGGTYFQVFGYKSTTVGSIQTNGTTTSYNITSDQRLKTNIVDAPAGNIDYIKVRSFDWKSDNSHVEYGFIAQELIEAAPYAVTKGITEEDMLSVDYSKLVPMMIKEIQDLKAEVTQLKAKVGI